MTARWTWLLCDSQGTGLAELATAQGRTVHYRRNTYSEAACTTQPSQSGESNARSER